jgi:hypothetical protein
MPGRLPIQETNKRDKEIKRYRDIGLERYRDIGISRN